MEHELTVIEHIAELRKRAVISLVSLGIGSILSLPFASSILRLLKLPAANLIEKLAFFSPQEAFLVYMRVAFLCGLVISIPVILYQIWAFILPAMEERYKRHTGFFILSCSVSFVAGCLFAFFFLIPPALKFLLGFAQDDLQPVISASRYISFVIGLILGCGLLFQMPVLSLILSKLGIINASTLRRKYKYAIIIISVTAAVITPTADAFNMLLLVLPMLLLYEVSIWVAFFAQKKF